MIECIRPDESMDDIIRYCLGRSYFAKGDHFMEIFLNQQIRDSINPKNCIDFEVEVDSVCQEICNSMAQALAGDFPASLEERCRTIICISCISFVTCLQQETND